MTPTRRGTTQRAPRIFTGKPTMVVGGSRVSSRGVLDPSPRLRTSTRTAPDRGQSRELAVVERVAGLHVRQVDHNGAESGRFGVVGVAQPIPTVRDERGEARSPIVPGKRITRNGFLGMPRRPQVAASGTFPFSRTACAAAAPRWSMLDTATLGVAKAMPLAAKTSRIRA